MAVQPRLACHTRTVFPGAYGGPHRNIMLSAYHVAYLWFACISGMSARELVRGLNVGKCFGVSANKGLIQSTLHLVVATSREKAPLGAWYASYRGR